MLNDIHNPRPVCWTGAHDVDLKNPDPLTINIRDIARSLSRRPRYGGFSDKLVTVGQHSLLCLDLVQQAKDTFIRGNVGSERMWAKAQLAILLHDAAEAYLSDIQRPLKRTSLFTGYRQLEQVFEAAIADRFDFSEALANPSWPQLKRLTDEMALAAEVAVAFPSAQARWSGLPGVPEQVMQCARLWLGHTSAEHIEDAFVFWADLLYERMRAAA